jgi:hypothetical protein
MSPAYSLVNETKALGWFDKICFYLRGKYAPVMTYMYINNNKTWKIQTINNTNSDQLKYNTQIHIRHLRQTFTCRYINK